MQKINVMLTPFFRTADTRTGYSRDAEATEPYPGIEQERRSPKNNGW